MLYFKHSELVNDYHVSLKTVHNWIDSAKQGKLELQLHEVKGRVYVANTPNNLLALGNLVEKGKKYRNSLHHKVATPKPKFYETYSDRQILDIISSITTHHEIPSQYNYFDGGATNWMEWTQRLRQEKSSNILNGTIELLKDNFSALDRILEGKKRVNVIDLGVGDAEPVRDLLGHLVQKGMLHRYIGLDISKSMLALAESHIKEWFDGRVQFEGHVRDITFERFDDLLVDDMLGEDAEMTVNVVLLFGGTLNNFRSPLYAMRSIYGSMGPQDIFVYVSKPDTKASRRYFDFSPEGGTMELSPLDAFTLNMLNVEPSSYEPEMGYDEQDQMRFIRIRMKCPVTIQFTSKGSGKRNVNLEKGDTVLLWRAWHKNTLKIIADFDSVGFAMLHSSLSQNREYLLTISSIAVDAK